MEKIFKQLALVLILFLSTVFANAQKTNTYDTSKYPNLILKTPYAKQLQEKVNEIQKKVNAVNPQGPGRISPVVLNNINNARDFIAGYNTTNAIVGPMFFPGIYRTYLRIGEYTNAAPLAKDQVLSAFFNEKEQSSLISDKDFTNRVITNSMLKKDVISAWEIETSGTAGFKISTTGTKKYLGVKRTGGSGTEKITLTTDKNDLSTNWVIYSSAENGITFYNSTYNIFLGRRVQGRKVFLTAFSYKEYGNVELRKIVILSWDLYHHSVEPEIWFCYDEKYSHSLRYILSSPLTDADGDGHNNILCGGDDCDDNDASRYPGNVEVCDTYGNDEDCNDATYGNQDNDGDGYFSATCFNIRNGVITSSGNDCDDNNPAIFPGQQIFVNERTVEVCNVGVFEVAEGYIAVKQLNGTAIVMPKN